MTFSFITINILLCMFNNIDIFFIFHYCLIKQNNVCPKDFDLLREKEEFSRVDPDNSNKIYWLAILNWLVPICLVFVGLIITTQKFAPLMNYDPNVIGEPIFVTSKGYRFYNPLIFLIGMIKFAFNETYSFYFFQAIPPTFISLVLAILLFIITSILVNSHQKNQHIHGTARYATKKDLKKYGLLQKHGVICGELENAKVNYKIDVEKASLTLHCKKTAPLICHSGRTNTLLIAPTRAGKGVSSIISTLLSYGVPAYTWIKRKILFFKIKEKKVVSGRGSIVCFDPKGENWAATAGFRSKFSRVIPFRPLDPDNNTAHYNPIWEIPDSPSEAFSWADTIGEIFFGGDNAKSANDGATQYFNNTARDIFTAVVMHVRFAKDIPWESKNLANVLHIFSSTVKEDNQNSQQDEAIGPGAEMLKKLCETDHGNKKIHLLIVEAANRSKIQTPKERASTYSTVFSKISLFQDPLLAQATAYSDFSVDDFITSKNGISLYLIVPYNHIRRISPVFRMIITFMIKKFSAGETNANEVKLKIPCLFLLDEFPVLGFFPDIAQNAGILCGYGVTFFIVCQALNQLIDVYGENHPFLDHCKTIILFAPGSIKDARMFSESIGNRSVLLDNISASGNKYQVGFNNISRSSQETSTSLISPDELMKLEFNRLIVINQGMPPYKGKKVVYYEDPRFKTKAFLKVPSMKWIKKQMNQLPSNTKKKKSSVEEDIQNIINRKIAFMEEKRAEPQITEDDSVSVTKVIDSRFAVFPDIA